MNQQLKTVLLTVLTLSVFVIALVELSGVSKTALINKWEGEEQHHHDHATENKAAANIPKTTIAFEDTKHSFGTITDGEVVRHAYKFKNTGDHPLVISNAVASCGCTVPSYPKKPIAPGESGEIVVEFNSANRLGHQQKNVLVYSNAQEDAISIGFDADVKEKQ
ncbi:MAG TPA: DUF1573 domain-containing protein [Flavipsychrobacter sp.]|nr:DUF1573 domain-containing protein [Flavipsychrobacter sp.]